MVENKGNNRLEVNGRKIEYKVVHHKPIQTIDDVAKSLGVSADLLVKVMIFAQGGQDSFVVAALQGSSRVDWKKLAQTLGVTRSSISLVASDKIEGITGSKLGALKPFGYDSRFKIIFDRQVIENKVVFCSAGTNTDSLVLRSRDLLEISRGKLGRISQ